MAALPRDVFTGRLLDRARKAPSEVLLNINVEAVGRLGGCLERRDGEILLKPGLKKGVERVDRFFGDTSWRHEFYAARADAGAAASAAEAVVAKYCTQVEQATGYRSTSVPIRQAPVDRHDDGTTLTRV